MDDLGGLDELLELERLAKRESGLTPALEARRQVLRDETRGAFGEADGVEGLAARAAGRRDLGAVAPGLRRGFGGVLGEFASRHRILSRTLAGALVVGGAVWGPLDGRHPLSPILDGLRSGALPAVLFAWGVGYPWVLIRAERRADAHAVGLPALEGSLFVALTAVVGVLGVFAGLDGPSLLAITVGHAGFALASIALLRPGLERSALSRAARSLLEEGLHGLRSAGSTAPARARRAFEAAIEATLAGGGRVGPGGPLLRRLRVAALMEAESERRAGRFVEAVGLLRGLHIDPAAPETRAAVAWVAAEDDLPEADMLEAAGLHAEAGFAHAAAGRASAAERAFTTAGLRALSPATRFAALEAILDLGAKPPEALVIDTLGDLRADPDPTRVGRLSRIAPAVLDGEAASQQLQFDDPARAIHVLEGLVGDRGPTELPRLHRRLATAYRQLGHRGTARRIEAELERTPPSVDFEPSNDLDTNDLAVAMEERYALLGRLGAGAMGEVHLAEDQVLGRKVAIKVLRPGLATALYVEKFRAEARLVAQLEHPGIVRVYDAGQTGPWLYFVMEHVDGPDLATAMRRPDAPGPQRWAEYMAQVAEAMAYAHAAGVVHRDLKPANILVAGSGHARVTDFGIAHVEDTAADATSFARAGLMVGTPAYMAPEQLADGAAASVATDIYALGVTAFALATRSLPFGDSPYEKIEALRPPSARARGARISEALDAAIGACLHRQPQRRPANMATLARALRACPELAASRPAPSDRRAG